VVLDLTLDDLAVGQPDAEGEKPAPALVQGLQVDELRPLRRIRAYRTSSL
jgi:hypothetical protein